MAFQDVRTEVTTDMRTIQNGVDDVNYKISESEDAAVIAFDSLEDIHNDDSDQDEHVIVTKKMSYTYNTSNISGDHENNLEVNSSIITDNHDVPFESDWQLPNNSAVDNSCYVGETVETSAIDSQVQLNDSAVADFFTVPDEEDFTEHKITMRTEEDISRPYGGGLAVAMDPHSHDINPVVYESAEITEDSGYEPPEPLHSEITDADVLITSEIRNADEFRSEITNDLKEVENANCEDEFEIPEMHVNTNNNPNEIVDVPLQNMSDDDGIVSTIKENIVEIQTQGLDYAGEAVNDKMNDISDDGLIGKVKGQVVDNNAVDAVKDKITIASNSIINDDALVDTVKDKVASAGDLDSFHANLPATPDTDGNNHLIPTQKDDSIHAEPEHILNSETEAPVLEIDTANALEDDMDYELQEVDISQSNEDDFGKVFAEHRQSMRDGNAASLFHQDAKMRFNANDNTGTLKSESKHKSSKSEKEKNGSSYTVNSMPTDGERPQKGCTGILRSFFCPKRGSWQPEYF